MTKNKNCLLIAPRYFDYHQKIETSLVGAGYDVHSVSDRPSESPFVKAFFRFAPTLTACYLQYKYSLLLKNFLVNASAYDLVFVVVGEALSPKILSELKSRFSSATFVLYLWDSLKNKKRIIACIPYYHKVFTFDPGDAFDYGLKYHPLFFSDNHVDIPFCDRVYDCSFVGTVHSDRYSIIKSFSQYCMGLGLQCFLYMYMQSRWVFYVRKFFTPGLLLAHVDDFSFVPLSREYVDRIFYNSKSVIDVEHPNQSGLTIRTFEAMSNHVKLITTNQFIKEQDFYDPHNIYVVDRLNPIFPPASFFESEYVRISDDILSKYHIDNWLMEMLNE